MEMDVSRTGDETGRVSKQGKVAMGGGSVWETRMRMDQLRGGIKVFGLVEREEEERVSNMFNRRVKRDVGGGEEETSVIADSSSTVPLRRAGASGGKRRTWKPQPGTFEGPNQVIAEKSDRDEISESINGPTKVELAESRRGKLEIFPRSWQKISNGAGSIDPMEISDSESLKQFGGSLGKAAPIHSKKKSTPKSHSDPPKKPLRHADHFRSCPQALGLNNGVSDEEDEEFFDIKEVSVAEQKPKAPILEQNKVCVNLSSKKTIKPNTDLAIRYKQQNPSAFQEDSPVHQSFSKESSYGSKHDAKRQNILQNLSDLVMWRCLPKTAIVFGLGALIIISSSWMSDADICFISAISYLGLACLSTIFLYRSIISRNLVDIADTSRSDLGEEEAHCLTKLALPYLNGFVRQLRALIYGEPTITLKLAVVLFVLARCGSLVTMWNMIKLGFLAAFTIPKLWSLYSTQLTVQGKYWVQASQRTWDSCPQKAVAAVVLVLVMGFSSSITRIWAGSYMHFIIHIRNQLLAIILDGRLLGLVVSFSSFARIFSPCE
ncbi:hypothetical protein SAY87_018866 [Trapa incisa]|uniref:Reticulon-like protein n=1 Tax=Trapa incisa TaxID=236973 RepID=A0AAN7Q6A9_9MYRT|nr:hypothetical protein SAY87_018866 [Trapa incisa]